MNVPILIDVHELEEMQTALNEIVVKCKQINSISEGKHLKLKELLGIEKAKQVIDILFGDLD